MPEKVVGEIGEEFTPHMVVPLRRPFVVTVSYARKSGGRWLRLRTRQRRARVHFFFSTTL